MNDITGDLGKLTRTQLEDALLWLHAYDRDMFADAVAYALSRTPAGNPPHGENHIGNDGNVVSAIHPGQCITCHATVDTHGDVHPAGAVA